MTPGGQPVNRMQALIVITDGGYGERPTTALPERLSCSTTSALRLSPNHVASCLPGSVALLWLPDDGRHAALFTKSETLDRPRHLTGLRGLFYGDESKHARFRQQLARLDQSAKIEKSCCSDRQNG